MESFFLNPFFYVKAAVAFVAAMGFLVYLRGFIAGIGDVFTILGHAEHVREAHVRVAWGVLIMTSMFILWELVRWIGGWFI